MAEPQNRIDAAVARLRGHSRFHGLMVGVDGHWAYVGDAESAMRDYLTEQPTVNVEPSWDERMRASRPVDLRDHAYEAWEEAEAARRRSAPDAADQPREETGR